MNGSDTSTTFTDESGLTWTARGNAQIDTAQSVFGGASGLFDGAGDWIDTPDSAEWILDDGSDANKWTIDFRVRFNGDPGTGVRAFCGQSSDAGNYWYLRLNNNALELVHVVGGFTTISISNAWNPGDATWYHVAIVKDGANGYMMFINGTQIGVTQTDTTTFSNFGVVFSVGGYTFQTPHNGWIDEFRLSKGIARWTADFMVPNTAYPIGGQFICFSS